MLANGGVDETVAKLLACEEWSEPFYLAEATRFLRWVVRAMEGSGTRLTLPAVLGLCDPDRLAAHAAKHGDRELAGEVDRFVDALTPKERSDVAGLRSRLAVLAESEFGRTLARSGIWRWPGARSGRGDSPARDHLLPPRQRADGHRRREGRSCSRDRARRDRLAAAGATDPDAGGDRRVRRDRAGAGRIGSSRAARAAGISAVLATQTVSDIEVAGDGFDGRVKGNVGAVLGLRMGPDDADVVARMAGQVGEWQRTTKTNGLLGMPAGTGTRTQGYRMRIHPSVLQHLGFGECAVIRMDRRDDNRALIVRVVPSWERDVERTRTGPAR